MGEIHTSIEAKLRKAFDPVKLVIKDESAMHAGHAGAPEGGESHFAVEIHSKIFQGKNRVDCHRLVNDVLSEELKGRVHALRIIAKSI